MAHIKENIHLPPCSYLYLPKLSNQTVGRAGMEFAVHVYLPMPLLWITEVISVV